jgi:outer membrane protein assembly factor BamB
VRACVSLVALSLAFAGCSVHHGASNRSSLAILRHFTADQTSFGVILNAKTGQALAAFRVNNPIRAAIPDANGGWYIGGGFIHLNGVLRKRLAHIDRNGRLDPDWRPEANGNGVSVTALARIGSRLYVAGDFARLQRKPRFHLGALDVNSGRLEERWRTRADLGFGGQTLLGAGGRLIVGGGSCCSEAGASVGALDAATGAIDTTWRPHVGGARLYGGGVYMLVSDGRGVLIRSLFGRPQGRVAVGVINPETGRLERRWRPKASATCPWCSLMAAGVGRRRVFASINGSPTFKVLAFGANGEPTGAWRVRVSSAAGFYGAASAYALSPGARRVYVAGDFDRVNGVRRFALAALDPATANVLRAWEPKAGTASATMLVRSGSRILVGVTLGRGVRFDFTGLTTYRPVSRLHLVLGLSSAGSVRIGIGRKCNFERWAESARCEGKVFRWFGSVRFERAERHPYDHALAGLAPGRYFVRFIPRAAGGSPEPPDDFWFRIS